jgi:6-phosphofructokinase 2
VTKPIVTMTFNPALDTSTSIHHVVPEKKLRCNPPRHDPGGGGVNVARAVHRLGGDALAVFTQGGPLGRLLVELLEKEDVPRRSISIEGFTRESFTVRDETSGQQYRFSLPGPELSEAEYERCFAVLEELDPKPDYVVASGSLTPGAPRDGYVRLARLVREWGGRFILDSSGEEFTRAVNEAGVYLLKPNMRELKQLMGEEIQSEQHQEEAAQALVNSGKAEVVVVSLGAAGALFVTKDEMARIRAPTVNIQSKIGAGDSMVGGIALGLARDMTTREAARFGVAVGSATVMTAGTELCRRKDAERLFERMRTTD